MKRKLLALLCALACLLMLCACNVSVNTDEAGNTTVTTDGEELEDTATYVTNTYNIDDSFENISISVDVDEITILPAQDNVSCVECVEDENRLHTVAVVDNTLTITTPDEDLDSDGNGLNSAVTIFLDPDIMLKNISIEDSLGNATIENIGCENLTVNLSLGNLNLTNVIASGNFNFELAGGSVTFNDCDAQNITASTALGEITGTLLTGKNFTATAELGTVDVPENSGSGNCELTASMGSIQITVK